MLQAEANWFLETAGLRLEPTKISCIGVIFPIQYKYCIGIKVILIYCRSRSGIIDKENTSWQQQQEVTETQAHTVHKVA